MRDLLDFGTVVDGVAARFTVVDVVDAVEDLWSEVDVACGVAGAAPLVDAMAPLMAMPVPRVVATPMLSHAAARRLRAAGWGRRREVMGPKVRIGGETDVKGRFEAGKSRSRRL